MRHFFHLVGSWDGREGGRDQSVQYGRRAHVSERASEQPLRNPLTPHPILPPSRLLCAYLPVVCLLNQPPLRQRTASLWILMSATPIRPAYERGVGGWIFSPPRQRYPPHPHQQPVTRSRGGWGGTKTDACRATSVFPSADIASPSHPYTLLRTDGHGLRSQS